MRVKTVCHRYACLLCLSALSSTITLLRLIHVLEPQKQADAHPFKSPHNKSLTGYSFGSNWTFGDCWLLKLVGWAIVRWCNAQSSRRTRTLTCTHMHTQICRADLFNSDLPNSVCRYAVISSAKPNAFHSFSFLFHNGSVSSIHPRATKVGW